jgi:hypothetical protein
MPLGVAALAVACAAIALVAFLATRGGPSPAQASVEDVSAGRVAAGNEATLRAQVVSASAGENLVVAAPGSLEPTVAVELVPPGPGFRIGAGSDVTLTGTVSGDGRLLDALVVFPSPPTKYIEAIGGSER